MMIVPAVLAEDKATFISLCSTADRFAPFVQIDMMDGIFVPSRSIPPEEVDLVRTSFSFELHLMVNDPDSFMDRIKNERLTHVIVHAEAPIDHRGFAKRLEAEGLQSGLAIKPATRLADVKDLIPEFGTVLCMTVDPGRYGSPFKADVLDKVADIRKEFPGLRIGVDGGVSLENVESVFRAGADYACVGSRIFLDENPGERYRAFVEKVRELEAGR
jgi:ribulose-phosphate 3-epimerase